MKTVGLIILGAVVGALAAGFVSQSVAQDAAPQYQGVYYSNPSWERYDMSVGITTSGIPRTARRLQHEVQQLNRPDYFGKFVAATAHGDAAVLWFKDDAGALRSTIIPDASKTIYRIDVLPAGDVEIRQKPN